MGFQIIPEQPSTGQRFAKAFGAAAQAAGKGLNQYQLEKRENQAIKDEYGLDLSGVRDPQTRQMMLADRLQYGRKLKQAQAARNVNYGLQDEYVDENVREPGEDFNVEEFIQKPTRKSLPKFLEKDKQQLPETSTFGPRTQTGNRPEPQTRQRLKRILEPEEVMKEAQRIQAESSSQGDPMRIEQAYNIANTQNEERRKYNTNVEADREKRRTNQKTYGNLAVENLKNVLPERTKEQEAYFQKIGENVSGEFKSEADINRYLSKEAVKFKNTLANVKKSIPNPNTFNKVKLNFLGADRKFDKVRNDARLKLDPLLKEGLFDTARNLLSEAGYGPVITESIIADLGEGSKKAVGSFTPIKRDKISGIGGWTETVLPSPTYEPYTPEQQEQISDSIRQAVTSEPSVNLLLLREAYDQRGVDWQEFKDNINYLVGSGEMELNDEQFKMLDKLDYPSEDVLQKLIRFFGFGTK